VIPLSLLQRPRVDVTLRISACSAMPFLNYCWMTRRRHWSQRWMNRSRRIPCPPSARREAARRPDLRLSAWGLRRWPAGPDRQRPMEQLHRPGEAYLERSGWRYESGERKASEAVPDRPGLEQRLNRWRWFACTTSDNRSTRPASIQTTTTVPGQGWAPATAAGAGHSSSPLVRRTIPVTRGHGSPLRTRARQGFALPGAQPRWIGG